MGLGFNDCCPYKRKKREIWPRDPGKGQGRKAGLEISSNKPSPVRPLAPAESGREAGIAPPRAPRENNLTNTLIIHLWPSEL